MHYTIKELFKNSVKTSSIWVSPVPYSSSDTHHSHYRLRELCTAWLPRGLPNLLDCIKFFLKISLCPHLWICHCTRYCCCSNKAINYWKSLYKLTVDFPYTGISYSTVVLYIRNHGYLGSLSQNIHQKTSFTTPSWHLGSIG